MSHLPTIHSGGTSREELVKARIAASNAVNLAMCAMVGIAPNGRDYPNRPEGLAEATQIHRSRVATLSALFVALSEELIAIDGSGGGA